MTTSQKQKTDNYVLVRDEGGYWNQTGNDIERYRIELLKDAIIAMIYHVVLLDLKN